MCWLFGSTQNNIKMFIIIPWTDLSLLLKNVDTRDEIAALVTMFT